MFWILYLVYIGSIIYGGLLFWLEKPGGFWFLLFGFLFGWYVSVLNLIDRISRDEKE